MADPKLIEERLIAVADTVRAMTYLDLETVVGGLDDPRECVVASWYEFDKGQTARRVPPTEEAMEEARIVIWLLAILDHAEAELVWLRACGHPWRVVSHRTGCVRPKAWGRWKAAIAKIGRKARGRAKGSPSVKAAKEPKADDLKSVDPDRLKPGFPVPDRAGEGPGARLI